MLIVDLDQQGSLTMSAGLDPDALDDTIYNVLLQLRGPEREASPAARYGDPAGDCRRASTWRRLILNWRHSTWS